MICTIMPTRNEEWCLGLTARAVLMWSDQLVLLDHASDNPLFVPDLVQGIEREVGPGRISWMRNDDPEWYEMAHRQSLLEMARKRKADMVGLVDADEVLTGNLLTDISYMFRSMHRHSIFQLPWIQLRGGIDKYHADGVWSEQWVSYGFVDRPEYHWAQRDGYDFHHRHPMGPQMAPFRPIARRSGGLMHLQMASERRLRAKQALYCMTEVLRWPGRKAPEQINGMYNLAVYGAEAKRKEPFAMADCKPEWWEPYKALMCHLNVSAEPWQEARCRALWNQHGAVTFSGLDLYGVVG